MDMKKVNVPERFFEVPVIPKSNLASEVFSNVRKYLALYLLCIGLFMKLYFMFFGRKRVFY